MYKHVLPRVLEITTNNEYIKNREKNVTTTKLPLSPPTTLSSKPKISHLINYDTPLDTIQKERQSRVDKILEKYRRQPSGSINRQFSRSISCNTTAESTLPTEHANPYMLRATRTVTAGCNDDFKSKSGPRSVSPYALFDQSDLTSSAVGGDGRNENKVNIDGLLPKSYSLKSLGEYKAPQTSLHVDYRSVSKSNGGGPLHANNDEDPPSWSSSSSTNSISKVAAVPREDVNNYSSTASSSQDWTVSNICNEETVSDRIRRRSFYVKLK